jgi:Zn-dependent peptidase ImmA (M78 family)
MQKMNNDIEQKAQDLLDSFNMSNVPVPVEDVAKRLGLNVIAFDLGSDVSGVLHIKKENSSIGYNPNESKVRQRFTIAHELGHFILHHEADKVFIDNEKYYQLIKFRSEKTNLSPEDYKHEKEANAFAAALLMPQGLVKQELASYVGFDLSDSSMITDLAKKFEVSTQAMSFRIINLLQAELI